MNIAIIGAGAAGCFAAIQIKRNNPQQEVTVYEAGNRLLAKVAVTGGGRCNLTNSFGGIRSLSEAYPRGARLMKRLFKVFDYNDAYQWFEREGVRLTTQTDHCVFPVSQDAMEIVGTLMALMRDNGVAVKTMHRVVSIKHEENTAKYHIAFSNGFTACADIVVVASGGSPHLKGLHMLEGLNLDISSPVPSLFSMCLDKNHPLLPLMGTVVDHVALKLAGTKIVGQGPLLITHWGISGPAVLKLSSYAARYLAETSYEAQVIVNWYGEASEEKVKEELASLSVNNQQKMVANVFPNRFNYRLWTYFLMECNFRSDMRWGELGTKGLNRLTAMLTGQQLYIKGKNKYKDEFVTCGGIALANIDTNTLESKLHPRLYFAGEVLDVDAVTGGFNLQAAWTMGAVVAESIGKVTMKLKK